MRKEEIPADITYLAFNFFYWFSRFEYALKENEFLKCHVGGSRAEPGWDEFVTKFETNYTPSEQAYALLKASPEAQVVAENNQLAWKAVDLSNCKSELEKVVRLLKTIRNNLFHGGKHGGAGWDDPKKTSCLLSSGMLVLDQLAELASIEADYRQRY
ncbi:hypothetical protein [Rhodoferax ferrireducens]|jgi:hypothetical protein|uniref:hypothetical protein n=1 Tax=Rhodoferax ferrireducens TaxID=192843 RepID=UPI003BB53B86